MSDELTEAFVAKIAHPAHKRDDVALWYEQSLRERWNVDYKEINHAIIQRWSIAALRYVKDKAWREMGKS